MIAFIGGLFAGFGFGFVMAAIFFSALAMSERETRTINDPFLGEDNIGDASDIELFQSIEKLRHVDRPLNGKKVINMAEDHWDV